MRKTALLAISVCILFGTLSAQGVVNLPSRDQELKEMPRVLENFDVIAMLDAGLSGEVVRAKIMGSACRFDTSPEALAALNKAGADDKVILAILEIEASNSFGNGVAPISERSPAPHGAQTEATDFSANDSLEADDRSDPEPSVAEAKRPAPRAGNEAPRQLTRNSRLYIVPMEEDLDGYIRAEIIKKKVPLLVVMAEEDADFIMIGSATEEERRKWHEGWLTAERDKTSGTVSIIDARTGSLVWAGEAGDRSLWFSGLKRGGHRKVADRLVKQLKKAVK
jgi:hypothetical protein